jgi:RNA polymerase subunit RPABC4/transcription elongation factor Spt4
MALISCGECGREVSNWARMCPHCGFPNPGTWWGWRYTGFVIVLAFVIYYAYRYFTLSH